MADNWKPEAVPAPVKHQRQQDDSGSEKSFDTAEEMGSPPANTFSDSLTVTTNYSYIGAVDTTKESFYSAEATADDSDKEIQLMDVPLAGSPYPNHGPPTPAMSDLNSFLDQAVYSLEELAEASQASAAVSDSPSSIISDAQARDPSLRGSITSSGDQSLPSYDFQPSIMEKSVLRSYRPSASQRLRGASLLALRRGRSSSMTIPSKAAAAADPILRRSLSSVGEHHHEGWNHDPPNAHKKNEARTEVTDSDDEEDGNNGSPSITNNSHHANFSNLSIGSLLKDTYSFIYIYPACPLPSAPFLYALLLFTFQSLVYALLLSSLIDVNNPNNPLHVPPVVSLQMRIAQACAILIAVFNSVDIMVAMNNLLRAPDAIVVMNSTNGEGIEMTELLTEPSNNSGDHQSELSNIQHGIANTRTNITGTPATGQSFPTGFRFKFANILRLIEGCLAVAASFILIVRSDDIIEMFINFAALEFVVNLDNLAFALAEHGLISDRLQDAARFVSGLGFSYHDHHHDNSNHHRTKKSRTRGVGSCTDSAGRLAQLKGSYLSRLFGSPVRLMKSRPDTTRRTTLFIMTLTLFGCWGSILLGLNDGDFLCKSLDVEFFHAHVSATSAEEAEDGIKPFLASRSGIYVATFMEDDTSFLKRLSNIVMGRSNLFLAYHKVDPKVETPQQEIIIAPTARLPHDYVEVVYFDPLIQHWIFTSCHPHTDLRRDDIRVCAGPQVHSIRTDAMDLTMLSSAAFHIVNENLDASTMILPASITCNECGRQETAASRSVESNVGTCDLSGGECSAPQEDLGFSRLCLCPPRQYGLFCADHYGSSCPTLEIIHTEGADEPPGAAHFFEWEERAFTLLENERGVGNTPIWERRYASKGYTDRVEWRGGALWTITRSLDYLDFVHTIAIAEGSAPVAVDTGIPTGDGVNANAVGLSMNVQPPPAGLMFHAPKSAAWGTEPDYFRPFTSYTFHCKAAPLVAMP